MMLQTIYLHKINNRPPYGRYGFSLIELLVVLVILAACTTMVVPFARRRRPSVSVEQLGFNIAQTIRYAYCLSQESMRTLRFDLNAQNGWYRLMQRDKENLLWDAPPGVLGAIQYFDDSIAVKDVNGFQEAGQSHYQLVLDPNRLWPSAEMILFAEDYQRMLIIRGHQITLEPVPDRYGTSDLSTW